MEDDDNFVKGAKKKKVQKEIHDLDKCVRQFQLTLDTIEFKDEIKPHIIEKLLKSAIKGEIEVDLIRSFYFKLVLGYFNNKEKISVMTMINDTKKMRDQYKEKLKKYNSIKQFNSDPLGSQNSEWSSFFEDNELKKMIQKDVIRTYQEKDLFNNNSIKEMLNLIIFIWVKENREIGYWQGYTDILGLILMAIHPYYNKSDGSDNYFSKIKNFDSKIDFKDLYLYFNDLDSIAADLYQLFNLMMNNGLVDIYCKTPLKDIESKKLPQFERVESTAIKLNGKKLIQQAIISKDKTSDMLRLRVETVISDYLKEVASDLTKHLKELDVDYNIILLRWYRCIFTREFHPLDCLKICDAMFAIDYKSQENYLKLMDFVVCAMIYYLKDHLLDKDNHGCYMRLNKYPPIESVSIIISLAIELMNKYDAKSSVVRKDSKVEKIDKIEVDEIEVISTSKTESCVNQVNEELVSINYSEFIDNLLLKYNNTFSQQEKNNLKSLIKYIKK